MGFGIGFGIRFGVGFRIWLRLPDWVGIRFWVWVDKVLGWIGFGGLGTMKGYEFGIGVGIGFRVWVI